MWPVNYWQHPNCLHEERGCLRIGRQPRWNKLREGETLDDIIWASGSSHACRPRLFSYMEWSNLSQSKPVGIRVLMISTEYRFSQAKPCLSVFLHLLPPFPFTSSHSPCISSFQMPAASCSEPGLFLFQLGCHYSIIWTFFENTS